MSGAFLIKDGLRIACWHGARSWNESLQARFASTSPKKWIIQVYAVTKDETEEEKEDFKQYTCTIEHQRSNSHHRK